MVWILNPARDLLLTVEETRSYLRKSRTGIETHCSLMTVIPISTVGEPDEKKKREDNRGDIRRSRK